VDIDVAREGHLFGEPEVQISAGHDLLDRGRRADDVKPVWLKRCVG
jgi:hypothetical protein